MERILLQDSSPHDATTQADSVGSVSVPDSERIGGLETRVAVLEAQHVWLRVEQLEAELARQAKLIDYVVGRDYGAAPGGADA